MKAKTKVASLLAAMTITAAGTALAEGPQWTYVHGGYQRGDSYGNDGKNNTWDVGGSYGFMDMWHVQADYANTEIRNGSTGDNIDGGFDQWSITAGANPHVNDSTDIVLDVRYGSLSPDNSDFSDADLWSVGAGVDSLFTDKLELHVIAYWTNWNANDSSLVQGESVTGTMGGRYHWTENFSSDINWTIGSSDFGGNTLGADFRYAFKL